MTRNAVPASVVRSWRPKASLPKVTAAGSFQAIDGSHSESGNGSSASDSDDLPPLPEAFFQRKSLRLHRLRNEESEVEQEIISLTGKHNY